MNTDTNIVLEGEYKNERVNCDTENALVWIGKKSKDFYMNFFYKENIAEVEKIDAQESSLSTTAGIWFGALGAIAASGVQDYLLRVKWTNKKESLIKVRAGVYELMLRNMTKSIPQPPAKMAWPAYDKETVYNHAIELFNKNTHASDKSALEAFSSIIGYKESQEYIGKLRIRIAKYASDAPKRAEEGANIIKTFFIVLMIIFAIIAIACYCSASIFGGVLCTLLFIFNLILYIAMASGMK